MITIYTSYYGNIKKLPLEKCVCISQGKPSWYRGAEDKRLAPPWNMVKDHGLTPEEWKRVYFSRLDRYDAREIAESLNGKIILCWEKPGDRCHRHYVLDWLKENGIEVNGMEWGEAQITLF